MTSEQRTRPTHVIGHKATAKETPARGPRGRGRPTRTNAKLRDIELLDHALDLFLEKGFERTSIDAITASAGMAKRTVYRRYHDKTGLFKAALQRAIEDWIVPVEALKAIETEDLEESLLRIGQVLVENIMSPAGLRLMRITNAESGRLPEIGIYAYKQGTERTMLFLADLFRRRVAITDHQIVDPEEAALGFLYLVVGGPASVTSWGFTLQQADIDKHTRECVSLFLHGYLPRNSSAEAKQPTAATSSKNQSALVSATPSVADGSSLSQGDRLKVLEEENRRLKILLVDSMLEVATLKDPSGAG